jgi:hypothetical protein
MNKVPFRRAQVFHEGRWMSVQEFRKIFPKTKTAKVILDNARSLQSHRKRRAETQRTHSAQAFVEAITIPNRLSLMSTELLEPNATAVELLPGDSIGAFVSLVRKSCIDLQTAAEMLTRLVANDDTVVDRIVDEEPSIPRAFLTRLLRVGERSLCPELLLNNCWAYRQIAALPYQQQKQVLSKRAVDLVVGEAEGDVLRVPLTELTRQQLGQVFTKDGLRSRDEQRAWLRRRPTSRASIPAVPEQPYCVKKDRLIVNVPTEFTRKDLLRIMEQMD